MILVKYIPLSDTWPSFNISNSYNCFVFAEEQVHILQNEIQQYDGQKNQQQASQKITLAKKL